MGATLGFVGFDHMNRLETNLIRVMSFAVPEDGSINEKDVTDEVIRRMLELVRIAEDDVGTNSHPRQHHVFRPDKNMNAECRDR